MISSKIYYSEFETAGLKFFERVDTRIDVRLLQKAVVRIFTLEHKSTPTISGISIFHREHLGKFFIANAIKSNHQTENDHTCSTGCLKPYNGSSVAGTLVVLVTFGNHATKLVITTAKTPNVFHSRKSYRQFTVKSERT